MDNTIVQQGRFTSTGSARALEIRSDVDWMIVYNYTQALAAQTTPVGVKYYWQRGMPAGSKWTTFKSNAANATQLEQVVATSGFTLVDTSVNVLGAIRADVTAVSNAAIPVVSNGGAANALSVGDIVRLTNIAGAHQISGMDFTVGHNTLTTGTFSLDYMPQMVAGTTGSWRKINAQPLFYPRRRYITKITQAASAVVTMSVTHGYRVGQAVRFIVPASFGMVEMNGLLGTITAIDTTLTTGNSITVNIDSTAFTAFAFPLTAVSPMTYAEVVPVGMDTASALIAGVDILSDATINEGYIGMLLTGGASCPGGALNDVMYWVAGKSFSVTNL